jgi:hypothetical protein
MRRERIHELHFIAAFRNVSSILKHGILCHERAQSIAHASVANDEIQQRRAHVEVPGGLALHRYANLYVDARNAMLYSLLRSADEPLAVLGVDPTVLDYAAVVVTDRNAASGTALFFPAEEGIAELDERLVFARWWDESLDARQRRQAEVLVPERVEPELVTRAYVSHDEHRAKLEELIARRRPVVVYPCLFFE